MGRKTREQEEALRGAVTADVIQGVLSIRQLARKHSCSPSTIKAIKANPAPKTGGPFEPGGPIETAQRALMARQASNGTQLAQLALDTVAQRVAIHNRLKAVQDQVVVHIKNGIVDMDDVKLLLALSAGVLRSLEDIDKAKERGLSALGGAPTAQELIAQIVEILCPTCKEQLEKAFTDGAAGQ
jgi:transposase-like protein